MKLYLPFILSLFIPWVAFCDEVLTNEPTPPGPFITLPTRVENYRLAESQGLYRKWTYDRFITENRGVGATFTMYESWLDSPSIAPKHWKAKIKIRVEPKQTKKVPGYDWIRGNQHSSEADLHYKRKTIYYGLDDNGKAVSAEINTKD